MKTITKKSARLVGSAGSLAALLELIRERMFWNIQETRPSEQFTAKFGAVFDLRTGRGWMDDAAIISTGNGRFGLYFL